MNKRYKLKKLIIVLTILFVYLFPSVTVFATGPYSTTGADGKTYTYSTEDDGTDGPDVKTLRFELTGYGGSNLGSGKTSSDFSTNSKYGWSEYEKDGQKYVVFAAATHEMLGEHKNAVNAGGKYWFYGAKFDHIHYFHYNDTVQFKFEDQNFDSEVYNGIILDSGDAMMFPQHALYKRESGINMFDVYFGANGESAEGVGKISGQVILVTADGTFASSAGTTNAQSKKNVICEFFAGVFHGIGDGIQMALNYAGTNKKWKDAKKLTYTKADIVADEELNAKIKVEDASSDGEDDKNKKDYKTIKEVNIASTADNRKGQKETIYASDTEIPVMPIDFYSSTIDKVQLFDIDFYNTKSKNSNKTWKGIRAFVASASHITMYIAAALLLTMLIWRSILFVRSALGDNPQGAYESRQIMDNFIKAIFIIRMRIFCNDINDVFL